MRVLLTGGSGFVGKAVLERIAAMGDVDVVAAMRCQPTSLPAGVSIHLFDDLGSEAAWPEQSESFDVVIHCASRVHVMNEVAADPLAEFRKVNVQATLAFARRAAAAGVKRFVFISSIKVNGEGTKPGLPYRAEDMPAPQDPYGVSKREAEDQLRQLAVETGMELTIIRPVLVYGPGVKANFHNMMRWLDRQVPLPFGAIDNRRSLVALDNLVDLIVTCCTHPGAANQTFLVSDGRDVSTTELLLQMAKALGKPARLLPIPVSMLVLCANLLGRRALSQRLCGSLQVDITPTCRRLGWTPPVTFEQALCKTAEHYMENKKR
ncbi:SDR family oxidoreductase [Pseudomonas sp. PCH44]|uniref:UDP-glucose 4-epimerase family protein n=1 Tax=Pseudomonas sp. PCH44 TaxID=2800904 RepID=UPI001BAFF948|nr:SDR family oxidoreductase [Pseudomonas sp. PCH44]MBS3186412.1 SDR family oxidoreductase [Pseudomonas sp. PCH44]